MKRETEKLHDEQGRIVAYPDGLQAKVNALRGKTPTVSTREAGQATSPFRGRQEGVALIPSVLDRAFKGGL
jgi:hypothetical protein